ncbi:nhl-1 [Bugula neritina]|uniref:Nhl-1 n=1 Tax=Bugula neritina TaxID=10212 RepID=A0A7J7KQX6_BUGNE|nr:nhl-1 [Bugula neritina]
MTRELEDSRETVSCAVCTQLFQDARILNCSHSFCLQCLIGCQSQAGSDGLTEQHCPICRELTVPNLEELTQLPPNVFANKVAELIRENDRQNNRSQSNNDEAEEDLASRFYVGDLLSSGREEPAAQPVWSGHTTAMISLSVVVACCSYLFGGTLLGSLVALCVIGTGISLALTTQQTTFQQLEHAYTCNGCNYKQIAVLRYKCGMCNDFTLCSRCFAEDNLSQRKHIFLKLKFLQRRELPLGPLLKPQAFGLAETFDFKSRTHGRAYVHNPDRLLRIPAIKCSFCGAMPIQGVRYKCG